MDIKYTRIVLIFFSLLLLAQNVFAETVKGIYLTQYNLENTAFLNHLIKRAKEAGVNTFVVDLEVKSQRYNRNIALLKDNNIKYVARITMFPGGGTAAQIKNPEVWQKKYALVQQAIDLGANEIQLDYIRYNTKQKPSPQNAKDILAIIDWYKSKVAAQHVPLQIDVFGIAGYGESKFIGQNIKLFSESVDAICPMVYPSHYTPFAQHYKTPYATVHTTLDNIYDMFDDDKMPMRIIPFIELSNYHFKMNHAEKIAYIKAQIKAVKDAEADGWYAWSAHNSYENLFKVLEEENKEPETKAS